MSRIDTVDDNRPEREKSMSDSDRAGKHIQICLRFAAECESLAAAAPAPELRERFQDLAFMWTEMAEEPRVLH